MERAAVTQTVVESARHRPAWYWAVVSAAAVCSVWGTVALAKQRKVKPGVHAFKLLRRQYATRLRPLLEDLVYLTMFLINLLVGVFYWLVDFVVEGRSPVDPIGADALHRPPRRGQIKRLSTRWAWARFTPKSHARHRCECWGWRVKDLPLDAANSPEILRVNFL
jgi:hypothetical protein